jgi:hypothetical protein
MKLIQKQDSSEKLKECKIVSKIREERSGWLAFQRRITQKQTTKAKEVKEISGLIWKIFDKPTQSEDIHKTQQTS